MDSCNNDNGLQRLKKYQIISDIASLVSNNIPKSKLYTIICNSIREAMRFPELTVVRIQVGSFSSATEGFKATPLGLTKPFQNGSKSGKIEIYYIQENDILKEKPFTSEESDFLDKISFLISGAVTKTDFERLLLENVERNKELSGLDRISTILKRNESIENILQEICHILPGSWKYPSYAGARLTYGDLVFTTPNFIVTPWILAQTFQVQHGPAGKIEICYVKEFSKCDEGPFLKEERYFIDNVAQLLTMVSGCKMYEQMITQIRERLKELYAINHTTKIITSGLPVEDTLQKICSILPISWQYSDHTVARITFGNKTYQSNSFSETPWVQREQFITIDNLVGSIEIYYLKEFPKADEGPFLKEERDLICNIARLIAHFLNNNIGRKLVDLTKRANLSIQEGGVDKIVNEKAHRYVAILKRVLVVSNTYDAYSLMSENTVDSFYDPIMPSQYWTRPEFTYVQSLNHALSELESHNYDLLFLISDSNFKEILEIHDKIRDKYAELPIKFVVNTKEQFSIAKESFNCCGENKTEIYMREISSDVLTILCKQHEDTMNCNLQVVPTILLIEDSPEYYSALLFHLYKKLIDRLVSKQIQKSNTRLRILLATNYETAIFYASLCSNSLVAIISDMEFHKTGSLQKNAGLELIHSIQVHESNFLSLFHSSDMTNSENMKALGFTCIAKNSPDFYLKIDSFVDDLYSYSIEKNHCLTSVHDTENFVKDFELLNRGCQLQVLKSKKLIIWLKMQGFFHPALKLTELQRIPDENMLINEGMTLLQKLLTSKQILPVHFFTKYTIFSEDDIVTVSDGLLGGKGRSVILLNSLIKQGLLLSKSNELSFASPVTLIIRTGEYERVIAKSNVMQDFLHHDLDANEVGTRLESVGLSDETVEAITTFVHQIKTPLAVRSSSIYEDSPSQPFSGVFETFIIPNSHHDIKVRVAQIVDAIKKVYASVFSQEAQLYYKFAGKNLESEKMAIVIQQLVGIKYDNLYYPQMSGVAASYNYYPIGHMKPEEGVVSMAFGLGLYVVEGRSGHRFSPFYPELEFGSIKDLLNGSQTHFYASDLNHDASFPDDPLGINSLTLKSIHDAEVNGSLTHCASVYDYENDTIKSNLKYAGPRIVDFADILKYNYIPLADSLKNALSTLEKVMNSPVEIEFAVNTCIKEFSDPKLYFLQVKPLLGDRGAYNFNISSERKNDSVLYSSNALGNGQMSDIRDVVIVNVDSFDRLKTEEMVYEVEYFNRLLMRNKKSYILIGLGRWGTRDKSLGVPVAWSQICNARVIVEVGLNDYPLETSLGSHFFHNVTSMQLIYIAISERHQNDFINWNFFDTLKLVETRKYFRLLHTDESLIVQADGKQRCAIVTKGS